MSIQIVPEARFHGATRSALFPLVLLAIAVGCQSPAMRTRTGLPNDVATAPTQATTPARPDTSQHAEPVMRSLSDESAATIRTLSDQPSVSANTNFTAVEQVGFVQRLRCGGGSVCGGCQACQPCEEPGVTNPVIVLGRPIDPQEFICNGGDEPPPARVLKNETVAGVEPQDAIVHYTTQAGDVLVQPSNRVCLYAPRFGAIRQVSGAVAGEKAVGPNRFDLPVGPNRFDLDLPSLAVTDVDELAHADVTRRIDAMRDRNRGVPVEGILQPMLAQEVLQVIALLDVLPVYELTDEQIVLLQRGAVAAQAWTIRDAVEVVIESVRPPELIRDARVEALVEYDFPDAGRLAIIKVADKDHAQQGEEVNFAIHVRNVGDSAVDHIELIDSLVTRLEYVDGSQKCDREAEFEAQVNAAGSTKLKWALAEPLEVGETVRIDFKCRVR